MYIKIVNYISNFKISSFTFLFILINPQFLYSHSGNTNSAGCHNDNINGGYHCHNEKNIKDDELEILKKISEDSGFVGELFSIYLPLIFVIFAILFFIFGRNK